MKRYDIHCHVFNKHVVTDRYVNILGPVLSLIDELDNFTAPGNSIKKGVDKLRGSMDKLENFIDAFNKDTSQEVFEVIDKVYGNAFYLTPLMIDLKYADDNDGNMLQDFLYQERREIFVDLIEEIIERLDPLLQEDPELKQRVERILRSEDETGLYGRLFTDKDEMFSNKNYEDQIAELKKMAKENERVLPFFGVDPRRERLDKQDVTDAIETNVIDENGRFAGVKLYAPMGFSPTDPILFGKNLGDSCLYKQCEENNVPITVHCSNGGFACTSRYLRIYGDIYRDGRVQYIDGEKIKFNYSFFSINANKAIAERAETLNHPKLWEKVLKRYPNLTINFAHFGGAGQMIDFATYNLPDSFGSSDFKDALEPLNDDGRRTVKEHYSKTKENFWNKTRYVLNQKSVEDDNERREVWNALYRGGALENWTKSIYDLIKKYPNAYTDISCFSGHNTSSAQNEESSLKEDLTTFKTKLFDFWKLNGVDKKIMYGSDFFFSLVFVNSVEEYYQVFKEVFAEDEFDTIASLNIERFLYGK